MIGDLGWEFEPLRSRMLVEAGQTLEMAYVARNIGSVATTGKARHIIGPHAGAEYLEIITCFCFFEQTLEAGEEVTMPMVLRVDYMVPEEISAFSVEYEFYPVDEFQEDADL